MKKRLIQGLFITCAGFSVNDIMTYIDRLLQGCSDKRCAEILKEVTEECQSRIDECKKGAYSKSLQ
jgi:hypothetical protein